MLKFKCFIEGVAEKMPIIPTKEHSFEWFQKAREFYSENKHLKLQIYSYSEYLNVYKLFSVSLTI